MPTPTMSPPRRTRRDALSAAVATVAALVVLVAPLASSPPVPAARAQEGPAQDAGLTVRPLADEVVVPPEGAGTLSVTRVELAPADRTDSLLLDGPAVVTVETGRVKVWTRAGTTLDGVPVGEPADTVYAGKAQTLAVPAGVRFRLRALGCTPAKLLFVVLSPRQEVTPS